MALPPPMGPLYHTGHPMNPRFIDGVPMIRVRVLPGGIEVYDAAQPYRVAVAPDQPGQPYRLANPGQAHGGRRRRATRRRSRRRINRRR